VSPDVTAATPAEMEYGLAKVPDPLPVVEA
jgi:hypothetical protein